MLDKDFTITADITVPKGGAEGMIVTFGGRFGGYALFLQKGKPVFVYNLLDLERFRWEGGVGGEDWLGSALGAGKHTLVFDFKYDGPGPGKGGTGVLTVDGRELSRNTIKHTIPLLMSIDETLDIGSDTRSPRGRQLPVAVPVHRQHQQADVQARKVAVVGGRAEAGQRRCCEGHGLGAQAGVTRTAVASGSHWPVNCRSRAPVAQWIEQPPPKR